MHFLEISYIENNSNLILEYRKAYKFSKTKSFLY